MKYVLIGELAGTCSDYGIAMYLRTLQRFLGIIQFVVPAILVVMATINLVQLMLGPDDPNKKKWKSLINKFIAAVIVFFIPLLVNVFFSFMPETIDIIACWEVARNTANSMDTIKRQKATETNNQTSSSIYTSVKESEKKAQMLAKQREELRKKVTKASPSTSSNTSTDSTATTNSESTTVSDSASAVEKREAVVQYALQFVGNKYDYGGYWNGELPYTPTDCAGFIIGVYKHYGYSVSREYWKNPSSSNIVSPVNTDTLRKGDIIFYPVSQGHSSAHVALYIGDGKTVHASNRKTGIKISNGYDYRPIKNVVRVIK